MDDDWRLQIDPRCTTASPATSPNHLRAAELEHDLAVDIGRRLIVSHEGEAHLPLPPATASKLEKRPGRDPEVPSTRKGWQAKIELRHWHKEAEDWEDPDAPEPSTAADQEASTSG